MKQNIRRFAFGSLLILLAGQIAGCSASQGIGPSQAICNQFLQDMKAGQRSSAYGLLSSRCKTLTSTQQVQNYWDLVEKNKGRIQGWSQQGVSVYAGTGGSSVNLSYALQGTKNISSVRFSCVKEDNKWLIQGFDFSG